MPRLNRVRRSRRLRFESLEDRRQLANLAITDAFLIDVNDNRLDAPAEGDVVGIRVEFQTLALPAGSQYAVQRCLNGTCQSATLDWGQGLGGAGNWFAIWRSWQIPAGNNTVQVTLDSAANVAETLESDNSRTIAFITPDTPDPSFLTPMGGTAYRDWYINNYVDIDPGVADVDFRGRSFTYDGHDAHDINLAGFEQQDARFPLYAAEAGRVIDTHDGEGDRCPNTDPNLCGSANYVIIDHGGGWTTSYLHLRKNSIAVAVGEEVGAGQFLGFVGSSGQSSGPHLHWAVYHLGEVVEVYQNPTELLTNPLPYAGDAPGIIDFTTSLTGGTNTSRGEEREVFTITEDLVEDPILWTAWHGLVQGTRADMIWYRPNNTEFNRVTITTSDDVSGGFQNRLFLLPDLRGLWQIAVQVNGVEIARTAFTLTESKRPEVKVSEFGTNFTVVEDGTSTPVRFDTVTTGGIGSTRTITVRNVGNDTLTLSELTVPTGFIVLDGLATSLEPGTADVITLQVQTATAGIKSGSVTFSTNDADEGIFNFPVEAIVTNLTVSLATNAILESAGAAATNGTVTRAAVALDRPITVYLTSSDPSEVQVPRSVTIPVGHTSVIFSATAVDDDVLDGPQSATVSASIVGDVQASTELIVSDQEILTVQVFPASISETAGSTAGTVTISRSNTGNLALPLVVTLTSSDTTEATIQSAVTILSGQTSVTVDLAAVDDGFVDGTQRVTVTASATGFVSGSTTLNVTDDESGALTVNVVAASIAENAGAAATTLTITRSGPTTTALEVDLSSSDTSEAIVTETATIPIGQASVSVNVNAVDDSVLDGTQTVTFTASAAGFTSGNDTVQVTDNEIASLAVNFAASTIAENAGVSATSITISRNTDISEALVIDLINGDPTEVSVPATVTIPAGEVFVNASVSAVDDAIVDGTQTVTITASAIGVANGSDTIDVTDNETATLTININVASVAENAGTVATTATITRNTPTTNALVVNLASNDTSSITVPATATIPAGQISVVVNLAAVDDADVDGTRTVAITASASGFNSGTDSVDVVDDETPTLTVNIAAASIAENAGATATSVTITRNTSTTNTLIVNLTSSDPASITVPATATIPAGQSSVNVDVSALDDILVDGTKTVTITATATGLTSGADAVDVLDNESPTLSVNIVPAVVAENAGAAATLTVTRNTAATSALAVNLTSSDVPSLAAPATVTIPAGQASVAVDLTVIDDPIVDGNKTVTITASATGFVSGSDTLDVTDNDVPTLTVQLAATSVNENAGPTATTVTITRNTATNGALAVSLTSSETAKATLPPTAIILAGDTSVTVNLSAIDDAVADGTHQVSIRATTIGFGDGTATVGVTDDDVATLTVNVAATSIPENAGTAATTITISRNTATAAALTVNLTSSDTSEATVSPTATIPAGQSTVTVNLNAVNDNLLDGTQTVTITATAVSFLSGSKQLSITDVNKSPIAESQTLTTDEDESIAITLTGNDGDEGGTQAITFVVTRLPDHGTLSLEVDGAAITATELPRSLPANQLIYKPGENAVAPVNIGFRIRDDGGTAHGGSDLSPESLVAVSVNPINDAPRLDSVASLLADELSVIEIQLHGTDIDAPGGVADTVTYSIVAGQADGMTLDSVSGQFRWAPNELQDGQHLVVFSLSDNHGQSGNEQTATITVREINTPPGLLNPGNKVTDELQALAFSLTAVDADIIGGTSDAISFSIDIGLQPGMTLDPISGAFSWTPGSSQAGVYTVMFRATDALGDVHDQSITITVKESNQGPTDILLTSQGVNEDSAGAAVGNVSVIDPDVGDIHTFQVSDNRFEIVIGQLRLKPDVALDFETVPSLTLEVTATDGGSPALTVTKSFTISVHDVNDPPSEINLTNSVIKENISGATVGAFTVLDQDIGQTHTLSISDVRFELIGNTLKLKDGQFVSGESVSLDVSATDSGSPSRSISRTVVIELITNPRAWKNVLRPFDTNGDGNVVPLDALRIINELNDPKILAQGGRLPDARSVISALPFYDTNGDGFCTPVGDVLPIINFLNSGSAEGESQIGRQSTFLVIPPVNEVSIRSSDSPVFPVQREHPTRADDFGSRNCPKEAARIQAKNFQSSKGAATNPERILDDDILELITDDLCGSRQSVRKDSLLAQNKSILHAGSVADSRMEASDRAGRNSSDRLLRRL